RHDRQQRPHQDGGQSDKGRGTGRHYGISGAAGHKRKALKVPQPSTSSFRLPLVQTKMPGTRPGITT
ncbi:MAG TPA: hypothetical protein VF583_23880, partial [Bradyrhizobium sp.]